MGLAFYRLGELLNFPEHPFLYLQDGNVQVIELLWETKHPMFVEHLKFVKHLMFVEHCWAYRRS